jgi:hypothetical protein
MIVLFCWSFCASQASAIGAHLEKILTLSPKNIILWAV